MCIRDRVLKSSILPVNFPKMGVSALNFNSFGTKKFSPMKKPSNSSKFRKGNHFFAPNPLLRRHWQINYKIFAHTFSFCLLGAFMALTCYINSRFTYLLTSASLDDIWQIYHKHKKSAGNPPEKSSSSPTSPTNPSPSPSPSPIKRWYYSTAHWQLGDVMVSDITFLSVSYTHLTLPTKRIV